MKSLSVPIFRRIVITEYAVLFMLVFVQCFWNCCKSLDKLKIYQNINTLEKMKKKIIRVATRRLSSYPRIYLRNYNHFLCYFVVFVLSYT